MQLEDAQLKKILLEKHYASEEDVKHAEELAKRNRSSLAAELKNAGVMTKDLLGQAAAEFFGVPYSDLNSNPPPRERVHLIPEKIAKKYRIVLFSDSGKAVSIATDTPRQNELPAILKKLFPRKTIAITYSLPQDIDAAFVHYQKSLETRFSKILKQNEHIAPEILDEIFEDAVVYRASDVHFEPQRKEVVVRFRVDGVLFEAGRIPKVYYENILNRIKVQNRLRIDEHYATQDGSMRFENGKHSLDIRTSIVPTVEGEKVVMRLLASYIQGYTLGDIGLSSDHQEKIERMSRKPFGMILVTGPTGSGKTTTLYSVLRLLNTPEVNITTIEDPVEFKVEGLNQIQVNTRTELTFAKGLRSIVRQDPDIILVGEIRDLETAEIAVNAALTGHLLLSTFHANDAPTAIPRLLDMEVEPFLLASTLEGVIAQRLVRKICERCRTSTSTLSDDVKSRFPNWEQYFKEGTTLYQGKGCENCKHTGYQGRTAIFEVIEVTPEIQDLVLQNPSAQQIWELAKTQGAASLFEDGIEKVKHGVTTVAELLRVAEPPAKAPDQAHEKTKERSTET